MGNKFIITCDDNTANLLKKNGFVLISHNKEYIFMNDKNKKLNFDSIDCNKYYFSDKIFI